MGTKSEPGSNASALLKRTCRLRILDFGDEDCRSSRSESSDVPGRVLSLRRGQSLAQPLRAFEPQLRDAVVRRLAAVYSAHPSRLEAQNVRYLRHQGQVFVGVVLLEGFRVFRVVVQDRELQHRVCLWSFALVGT